MYMVVDLHAMTVPFEPAALRRQSRQTAAALLACGVDPQRSALFKQSEVAQHAELNWVLSCFCSVGQMRRMTQFKDKSRHSQAGAPLGLFAYPVLQAADILLYRATHVPVGEDQRQHLELSRDVAQRVNDFAGEALFPPPEAYMVRGRGCRVMSLRDPTRKMSKSDDAPASRINLTDDPDAIRRKVARAVTDPEPSVSFDPESRPGVSNLVSLLAAVTECSEDDVVASMRGLRCADLKRALTDSLVDTYGRAPLCPPSAPLHPVLPCCTAPVPSPHAGHCAAGWAPSRRRCAGWRRTRELWTRPWTRVPARRPRRRRRRWRASDTLWGSAGRRWGSAAGNSDTRERHRCLPTPRPDPMAPAEGASRAGVRAVRQGLDRAPALGPSPRLQAAVGSGTASTRGGVRQQGPTRQRGTREAPHGTLKPSVGVHRAHSSQDVLCQCVPAASGAGRVRRLKGPPARSLGAHAAAAGGDQGRCPLRPLPDRERDRHGGQVPCDGSGVVEGRLDRGAGSVPRRGRGRGLPPARGWLGEKTQTPGGPRARRWCGVAPSPRRRGAGMPPAAGGARGSGAADARWAQGIRRCLRARRRQPVSPACSACSRTSGMLSCWRLFR